MAFQIKIDLPQLDNLRAQLPDAVQYALRRTAYQGQQNVQASMRRVFDRPTPWVVNSIGYGKPDEKGNGPFQASVFVKEGGKKITESAGLGAKDAFKNVLNPEIVGGPRHGKDLEGAMLNLELLKKGEFLVPAKTAPRDQYGNVQNAVVQRIIAQLRAGRDKFVKLARKQGGYYFFSDGSNRGVPRGIYWRDAITNHLIAIYFVKKNRPQYHARLSLRDNVQKAVDSTFWVKFNQSIRYKLKG